MNSYIERVLEIAKKRDGNQPEFLQALNEVLCSIEPIINTSDKYEKNGILERLIEPERVIMFRVPWVNDQGEVVVNRGYRVQYNSLIGPYKGGLRFHPSVNLSVMKFLGFEQIFKNALTGLPIGGAKGGSDFDPKGKSDNEVMRFCQSFMTELYRHIGQDVDVPAGDIGVGGREIGYLFGQYKRIKDAYEGGVLTGKDICYGGSLARKEATGYGLMFFLREMLSHHNQTVAGKTVTISGSGNVAIYACQKAVSMGAKVVAMCDSNGCIYDKDGIDLDCIKDIKEVRRGRIKEYLECHPQAEYIEQKAGDSAPIWKIKTDIALPCATQNELTLEDAKVLVQNGVIAVAEGANMPTTLDATEYLQQHNILFAPAKAANAGGVATSAIEMSQNSMRYYYTFEEVESKLERIMINIFNDCKAASDSIGQSGNYVAGANIAAFNKLANAMIAQGIV